MKRLPYRCTGVLYTPVHVLAIVLAGKSKLGTQPKVQDNITENNLRCDSDRLHVHIESVKLDRMRGGYATAVLAAAVTLTVSIVSGQHGARLDAGRARPTRGLHEKQTDSVSVSRKCRS